MGKRIKVKRTVERTRDQTSGLWWVLREGKRERGFSTREAARTYRNTPGVAPPGHNQKYLLALISVFGAKRVNQTLSKLGPSEALTLRYTLEGLSQTEIAKTLNMTQPAVNYNLRRGMERITYILNRPGIDLPKLRGDMQILGVDPTDIDLVALYLETTCQSDVAKKLGVTQGFVRYRLLRTKTLLEKGAQENPDVYTTPLGLLNTALENTNILHPLTSID